MASSIAKLVLSLLLLGQTLCVAQEHRHTYTPRDVVSTRDPPAYVVANQEHVICPLNHTVLRKRAPPMPQMHQPGAAWGATYVDDILEPPNSGWSRADIHGLAKAAYEQVAQLTGQDVNIVAALYVPGRGVYLGSIPHDEGKEQFKQQAPASAPNLWDRIEDRRGSGSIYHAEDMAMFWFKDRQQPQRIRGQYPEFSYIAVYGKKHGDRHAQRQDPCDGPDARIDPSCRRVLIVLDIAHGGLRRRSSITKAMHE